MKELNIRAGIIHKLCNFEPILFKELIIHNHLKERLKHCLMYWYLKESITKEELPFNMMVFKTIFGDSSMFIMELLCKDGYTLGQISKALFGLIYKIKDILVFIDRIAWPTLGNNIYGVRTEDKLKKTLYKRGIVIDNIESRMKSLNYDDITINVYGRPDGIVTASNNSRVPVDTIVEIKTGVKINNVKQYIMTQIAAYAFIYSSNILLIAIYKNKIYYKLFYYEMLISKFNAAMELALKNCIYAANVLDNLHLTDNLAIITNMELPKAVVT